MKDVSTNVPIETFLVVSTTSDDEVVKEIYICPSIEEANDRLEDLTFGNIDLDGNKIFHGVLIPAHTIPESFQGCTPYIIIKNPDRTLPDLAILEHEAIFLKESCSVNKVANAITNILVGDNPFDQTSPLPTIEDVFIFFGKEVIPVLQITEGSVFEDEEFTDRITSMAEKFKNL